MDEVSALTQASGLGTSIEKAIAGSVDGLNSCGGGTMIVFLMLLLSLVLNYYQFKGNRAVVNMVLNALLKKETNDDDDATQ